MMLSADEVLLADVLRVDGMLRPLLASGAIVLSLGVFGWKELIRGVPVES